MGKKHKIQINNSFEDNGTLIKKYEVTPIVKRLCGVLTVPSDFNYKIEKAKYLDGKHFSESNSNY